MELGGKRNLLIGLLFVLCLAGTAIFYFYLIKPVQAEIEQVKQRQAQEEMVIEKIAAQLKEKEKLVTQSTFMLQQKVPVAPLIDQFLLHLEKAESLTNNRIESIKIEENKKEVKPVGKVEAQAAVPASAPTSNESGAEGTTEQMAQEANPLAMPAELKRVSFTLDVAAPDYASMENFLIEMEQLQRIVLIDSIQFDAPKEGNQGTKEEELKYKLNVSVFYVENMNELIEELPKVEFVQPARKSSPVIGEDGQRTEQNGVEEADEQKASKEKQADTPTKESPKATPTKDTKGDQGGKPTVQQPVGSTPTTRTEKNSSISYYVLQAGAYSTAAAAEKEAANLRKKGWAAYVQKEVPPNRVYIGMATNLQDAHALGEWYRRQGRDVYVRTFRVNDFPKSIQGLDNMQYTQLSQLMEESYQLVDYLSQYSIASIVQSPSHQLSKNWEDLIQQQQKMNQLGDQLSNVLTESQVNRLSQMLRELNEGMAQLENYQVENKKIEAIWQTQQHVIQYALEYEKWLRQLK